MLIDLMHTDDVGVPETRHALGLGPEPCTIAGRRDVPWPTHLECHRTLEALMVGLIDGGHSPVADVLDLLVVPKVRQGERNGVDHKGRNLEERVPLGDLVSVEEFLYFRAKLVIPAADFSEVVRAILRRSLQHVVKYLTDLLVSLRCHDHLHRAANGAMHGRLTNPSPPWAQRRPAARQSLSREDRPSSVAPPPHVGGC